MRFGKNKNTTEKTLQSVRNAVDYVRAGGDVTPSSDLYSSIHSGHHLPDHLPELSDDAIIEQYGLTMPDAKPHEIRLEVDRMYDLGEVYNELGRLHGFPYGFQLAPEFRETVDRDIRHDIDHLTAAGALKFGRRVLQIALLESSEGGFKVMPSVQGGEPQEPLTKLAIASFLAAPADPTEDLDQLRRWGYENPQEVGERIVVSTNPAHRHLAMPESFQRRL